MGCSSGAVKPRAGRGLCIIIIVQLPPIAPILPFISGANSQSIYHVFIPAFDGALPLEVLAGALIDSESPPSQMRRL